MTDLKDRTKRAKVIKVVFFILVVLTLGVCGKYFYLKIKNLATRSTSLVESSDGAKNGEETSSESGNKIPEDFPKDFPVYAGAKLVSSSVAEGKAGKGLSLIWEATDYLSSVSKFYERELSTTGWTLSSRLSGASFVTFSIEKSGFSGFMGITKGVGNKVAISVTLGVK